MADRDSTKTPVAAEALIAAAALLALQRIPRGAPPTMQPPAPPAELAAPLPSPLPEQPPDGPAAPSLSPSGLGLQPGAERTR